MYRPIMLLFGQIQQQNQNQNQNSLLVKRQNDNTSPGDCICCKTLEHIIESNINKHLAFESILADCQHGFRSQRSCETQLVQFYHDMVGNLDGAQDRGQKQTDVIIMDFAKAFDKVSHRRLLYKLGYYGIRGSTHKWIS